MGTATVKYATADTQILTTKGQILKVAVSGVSGLVSGVFMGSPLVFGGICLRICALFGCICLWIWSSKHLYISLHREAQNFGFVRGMV
jgi:hypothetical protein